MTAKLTRVIEMMVFVLIGTLNKIQHSTAVKISSTALAKVFSMEFKVFRKKLVIIPTSELFSIIKITFGCRSVSISILVSVLLTPFVNTLKRTIATMLQKILSMYINTFCIKMSMSAPCRFSKYSLYTPAKQEHVVCKTRYFFKRIYHIEYISVYILMISDSPVQKLEVEKYLHGILCQGHGHQNALPCSRLSRSLEKTIVSWIIFC